MKKTVTLLSLSGVLLAGGLPLTATPAAASACAFDPNKVEYADDARIARKQHAYYCRHRLISARGALTAKGAAWFDLRNGTTPPARTDRAAERQLRGYRDLGLWNPNRIEYADAPRPALRQFKSWFKKGYISPEGAWTKKGKARFA
ncbi:hypothetical protein [Nonomuraea sp. NPDC050310]|uniref:hypothetical protein n=1 Tax=Nonomuraea sp. NPDC050310 TaxID=3154935 RepID=UPI003407BE92